MDDGVGSFSLTPLDVEAEGREGKIDMHLDDVARTRLTHGYTSMSYVDYYFRTTTTSSEDLSCHTPTHTFSSGIATVKGALALTPHGEEDFFV